MSLQALDAFLSQDKPEKPAAHLAITAAMRVALMHELSQPLSALASYIGVSRQLLKAGELDRAILAETMKKAEAEVKRTRDVLQRLRGFLTREKAEFVPINLQDLIRSVAERLRDEATARAVSIDVEPAMVPIVMADPLQIKQVLINLLSNAIDAAADTQAGAVRVCCHHEVRTIEIIVNDNGRGVASEIAEHLFEPFQTTKVRGMGLGLPLTRQIVEAHGGKIWWEPAAPKGTRFHVVLPVTL